MSVSFGNINPQQINPEINKRSQSQENFGAIDKEKLKQDTVEIAQGAKEQVTDNFLVKNTKKMIPDNAKKFIISALLTTATVIGFAKLGNSKLATKNMVDLGTTVDKALKDNAAYKAVSGFFANTKNGISKLFKKTKIGQDISETFATRKAKPKIVFAQGMGQGFKAQFANTVIDVFKAVRKHVSDDSFKKLFKDFADTDADSIKKLKKALDKNATPDALNQLIDELFSSDTIKNQKIKNITQEFLKDSDWNKTIGKLVGDNNIEAFKKIIGQNGANFEPKYFDLDGRKLDAKEAASAVSDMIGENFGTKNKEGMKNFLYKLKNGEIAKNAAGEDVDLSEFTNLKMDAEGLLGSWKPALWIESIKNKITKSNKPFMRGNLGDALIKYDVSAGKLADTKLAQLTQASLIIPGESISNFVCDASTFNLVLIPSIMALYNNVQDAPKEQKVGTIADDFIGSIGHMAIATPLAFGTTYGLATLGNLKGNTKTTKFLKGIGKFFGMGLDKLDDAGKIIKQAPVEKNLKGFFTNIFRKIKGFGGGALRFWLAMFVFAGLFAKPIKKVINKIFGKPYDPAEAQKQKQIEEQKKQIVPELGITQGELVELMQKNPQAVQRLQTDEKLALTIAQNPKALLDLLEGREVQYIEPKPTPAQQGEILSPANRNRLNDNTNVTLKIKPNKDSKNESTNTSQADTVTYIPSSAYVAPASSMSPEQQSEYDAMMNKSDKILKMAEKYI